MVDCGEKERVVVLGTNMPPAVEDAFQPVQAVLVTAEPVPKDEATWAPDDCMADELKAGMAVELKDDSILVMVSG